MLDVRVLVFLWGDCVVIMGGGRGSLFGCKASCYLPAGGVRSSLRGSKKTGQDVGRCCCFFVSLPASAFVFGTLL